MTDTQNTEFKTTSPLDEAGLAQLFTDAHTHTKWPSKPISEAVLKQLYDLVKVGSTSSKLTSAICFHYLR